MEDRPREKLLNKGREALSDAELIAILLGSGTSKRSAVEVAQELLQSAGHYSENSGSSLDELGRMTVKQLMKVRGIGEAKALTLAASLELGRRRKFSPGKSLKISSSKDVYNYYFHLLADQPTEHFRVLLLKRNNTVIRDCPISSGGISGTIVDPKLIFKEALENLASSLIVVHNHPSGSTTPSDEDKKLTQKLVEAGKFLDIFVLDHLIFADNNYFSFADEGLM